MRLIDADAATDTFQRLAYDDWNQGAHTTWAEAFSEAAEMVRVMPTVDAVEIIRCKDCKYSIDFYDEDDCYCRRPDRGLEWVGDWDFYCKAAERREDG